MQLPKQVDALCGHGDRAYCYEQMVSTLLSIHTVTKTLTLRPICWNLRIGMLTEVIFKLLICSDPITLYTPMEIDLF